MPVHSYPTSSAGDFDKKTLLLCGNAMSEPPRLEIIKKPHKHETSNLWMMVHLLSSLKQGIAYRDVRTPYERERNAEYAVKRILQDQGYRWVIRSAASDSPPTSTSPTTFTTLSAYSYVYSILLLTVSKEQGSAPRRLA